MHLPFTRNEIKSGKLDPRAVEELNKAAEFIGRSQELLRNCQAQVGMVLGEQIHEFLSEVNNQKFNATEYHHERLPDGQ